MYKYILSWILFVSVPCENLEPSAAHCYEVRTVSKEFTNRNEAIEFHDKGNYQRPNSITIDSVLITKDYE